MEEWSAVTFLARGAPGMRRSLRSRPRPPARRAPSEQGRFTNVRRPSPLLRERPAQLVSAAFLRKRQMEQEVLFDVTTKGISYGPLLAGLVFVTIDVLIKRIFPSAQRRAVTFFTCLACVVVIAITVFQISSLGYYKKQLAEHRCSIVEGAVTNFHPMPYHGHSDESFVINGVRFAYSDYTITPAFNNTSSHGGPIKPGMHLRVFYTDSRDFKGSKAILRIERLPAS